MLSMQRPWTLEDPEAEDHEVCLVTAFSAHLNIQNVPTFALSERDLSYRPLFYFLIRS